MRSLDSLREVYGIRRILFKEQERTVRVEYDATRLNEQTVAASAAPVDTGLLIITDQAATGFSQRSPLQQKLECSESLLVSCIVSSGETFLGTCPPAGSPLCCSFAVAQDVPPPPCHAGAVRPRARARRQDHAAWLR